ncbi:MAG TPA: universal stress protein [Streptosporangiaceae bacterium]|jgi:nucleotide-binding universal stress UspA family protein
MTQPRASSAIVVGVNSSDASRVAIEQAAREADLRHAPLIAVRAYSGERTTAAQPVPAGMAAAAELPPAEPTPEQTAEDARLETESLLRDVVREVLGDRAEAVEVRAVLGLAGRKIVETAHKVNAQLIVLATHGSRSMLLGTVSQYVLRKAPCPVLIVPAWPVAP